MTSLQLVVLAVVAAFSALAAWLSWALCKARCATSVHLSNVDAGGPELLKKISRAVNARRDGGIK